MDAALLMPLQWQLCISLLTLLAVYWTALAVYRLYLSTLAAFPGPKLAALSNWYAAYYDVYLDGQLTTKIRELHEQYGSFPSKSTKPPALVDTPLRANYPNHTHRAARM